MTSHSSSEIYLERKSYIEDQRLEVKLRDGFGTHGSRYSPLEVKLKSWEVGPKLKAKTGFHDTANVLLHPLDEIRAHSRVIPYILFDFS